MDLVMMGAFLDELTKMAANLALVTSGQSTPVTGGKPTTAKTTSESGTLKLKTETKPTNYSGFHNQPAVGTYGTAQGSKAVTPPPVKT